MYFHRVLYIMCCILCDVCMYCTPLYQTCPQYHIMKNELCITLQIVYSILHRTGAEQPLDTAWAWTFWECDVDIPPGTKEVNVRGLEWSGVKCHMLCVCVCVHDTNVLYICI